MSFSLSDSVRNESSLLFKGQSFVFIAIKRLTLSLNFFCELYIAMYSCLVFLPLKKLLNQVHLNCLPLSLKITSSVLRTVIIRSCRFFYYYFLQNFIIISTMNTAFSVIWSTIIRILIFSTFNLGYGHNMSIYSISNGR